MNEMSFASEEKNLLLTFHKEDDFLHLHFFNYYSYYGIEHFCNNETRGQRDTFVSLFIES